MKKPLPRGWQKIYFNNHEYVKIIDGDRGVNYPKQNEFFNNGYCVFLNTKNVTKYGFNFDDVKYINKEKDEKLRNGKLKKYDIVMTTRGTVGNIAFYDDKVYFENIRINSGMIIFRILSNNIFNKYLYMFLSSNIMKKQISNYLSGMAQPQLPISSIHKLYFLLPTLEEQKRITEVLSLCDELIETLNKLIEKKELYKKGVMQRVLSGSVRFEGFTDEWKEYKLKNIGTSYGGLTNKNASDFINKCNAKYITYKSIYDCNKIDINRLEDVYIEENEKQNLVQYGDIFFTISSETPDEVAISSVLLDEVENTYLNSFCFGFRFDFNILAPEFARYYFRSNYVRKYTYKLSQGSTRFNLSKNKFLEMIVKLPSIEEQKKIGELLSLIDQDIDKLKELLHLRKLQKNGLMQKLLTGEVRI